MADDVKWIRFKVGTFDGNSFKRIKRAKIDGIVDFRDKLTAIWFELLDLGGKVNNNGFLLSDEIAFRSYEDISIALDRTEKEIELCINWYIDNGMMEIIDDLFLISNWNKYQNNVGLDKIREQNRERQRRFKENKKKILIETKDKVTLPITLGNALSLKDNNISKSNLYYTNEILNKTFINYLEMRKKIKKPATERAIELVIKKLEKLSGGNENIKIAILEQSIVSSWQDVYELKNVIETKDDIKKSKNDKSVYL